MSTPTRVASFSRTRLDERDRASRYAVQASQRGRIIEGAVEAAAEKGAAAVTLTDIVSRARVSRTTFYEHFASKDECLCAAIDLASEVLQGQLLPALQGLGDRPATEALTKAVSIYCRLLADEPEFGRLVCAEAFALGDEAVARRDALVDAVVALIGRLLDRDPTLAPASRAQLQVLVEGLLGQTRRILAVDPSALVAHIPDFVELARRALGLPPTSPDTEVHQ